MSLEGRRITIRGIVQGVGFRPWVYRLATASGVTGRVCNDTEGVMIEAFGDAHALEGFLKSLEGSRPPAAAIVRVECTAIPPEPAEGFVIIASRTADGRRVSIPPDLATCPECAADIADPANRRYRYPFTNCTNCGPRFTIARDVPYDRAQTTMAGFVMCAACAREYETVSDRRFHAQPNACPACGPHLTALAADGAPLAGDPLDVVGAALCAGRIAAIKGLGGFHLACDARQTFTVQRLRQRKRRDEKPFAVMVASVAAAERLADLTEVERRVLTSVERPIVLLRRRPDAVLSPAVAPRNPMVGVMLPYTPLHHLLMAAVEGPLVMTSANRSEEPIAYRNDEAIERLRGIADLFVVHDREIETRCDDSVTRVIAGAPVVLRRSRGYVPRPISVARRFAEPILACGALLKNTFCFGVGDAAHLGPHVGDLENLETFESYEGSVARMARFLRVEPLVVAHDLHPDYLSTRYALRRSAALRVPVQHHHAHVASAMAEHGLDGQVIGVAYDGTGLGTDGTAWGGELLVASYERFERLPTFRPVGLPRAPAAARGAAGAAAGATRGWGGPPRSDRWRSPGPTRRFATCGGSPSPPCSMRSTATPRSTRCRSSRPSPAGSGCS